MIYRTTFLDVVGFLIRCRIVSDGENGFYHCRDGDRIAYLDAEFGIYSLFVELYERFLNEGGERYELLSVSALFDETMKVLGREAPSTVKLFVDYSVDSFGFLVEDLETFFTKGRSDEDAALLFTAIISADDVALFITCLVAASFILLHSRLEDAPLGRPDAFATLYNSLLLTMSVRLLLFNTGKLVDLFLDGPVK
jgi:hypothetical protein